MSKHNNKHWLKEKKLFSIIREYSLYWKYRSLYGNNPTRKIELARELRYRYYNEYFTNFRTAPWWYRNRLNRRQRYNSKKITNKILDTDDSYVFIDNYKDAPWFW